MTTDPAIQARLEELRGAIRAENISQGEIAELQGLAEHIDPSDVELLEWAGVPEFSDNEDTADDRTATISEPQLVKLLDKLTSADGTIQADPRTAAEYVFDALDTAGGSTAEKLARALNRGRANAFLIPVGEVQWALDHMDAHDG